MLDLENTQFKIHPETFIAPGARLIGAVVLEKGASIWYNSVLRADLAEIVIGEDTNIQDNSVIHVDHNKKTVVGRNVTVGHGAVLHACTIEDDCLIGMGAVVLDGALIRRGSLVGAGTVVSPGKGFPERSMILGTPAALKRTMSEDDVARIIDNARTYRSMWEAYVKAGMPVLKF